jgi:outer membrane biosynthesis protein TonB
MRRLASAAVVVLALAASACVSAQAKGDAGGPALAPPAPPPHTIIPVEIVEEPAAAPAPPLPAPVVVRPSSRPRAAKPDKPAEKPVEKPVEKPDPAAVSTQPPAPAPAPPLQTTANVAEVETTIRARIADARRDLDRIDARGLTPERRAQYDTAKRFLQQAEDALKVKNLVFAEQLADKAATLAAALAQK